MGTSVRGADLSSDGAVCDRVVELEEATRRYAAGFDSALLSADQAGVALASAVAIERMAATVKALAAVRVADTGPW